MRHVHLGAVDEEVDVYKVIGAVRAEGEEGVEVGETGLSSVVVVVGDGWSAELDGAVVGLQEFFVDGGALGGREVGLGWVVGSVGAVGCFISGEFERCVVYDWEYLCEQGFGSAFNQDWDGVVPVAIL